MGSALEAVVVALGVTSAGVGFAELLRRRSGLGKQRSEGDPQQVYCERGSAKRPTSSPRCGMSNTRWRVDFIRPTALEPESVGSANNLSAAPPVLIRSR